MPIIVITTSSPSTPALDATTTAQTIINACVKDAMNPFYSSGGNQSLLLDYVNRIQQQILRFARWEFMLSSVQRFITKAGQTKYWVGATGGGPIGSVETNLNLTDFSRIKEGTVYDRTNYRELYRVKEFPSRRGLQFPDFAGRPNFPKMYRIDPTTPTLIELEPPPNNNSSYRPVPEPPFCTTSTAGALAQRIYYVRVTFVDSFGNESTANSIATRIAVPINKVLVVHAPQPAFTASADGVLYNQYNVYVSTTEGAEVLQNASPIATTTNWTEPNGGLIAGVAFPTVNNIESLNGYVIEFRYYKANNTITLTTDIVQIPDVYKDIVIAGVNQYIYGFLSNNAETAEIYGPLLGLWTNRYRSGLTEMIKDFNLFPKNADFIGPDVITNTQTYGIMQGIY